MLLWPLVYGMERAGLSVEVNAPLSFSAATHTASPVEHEHYVSPELL